VSLFRVFLVQALFMWIIAISLQVAQSVPLPDHLTAADIAGILIWLTGFLIESSADRQLSRFIKDPANRGRVMRYRLWKYSRHPNYFGESTMWWGIYIVSCSVDYGFLTIMSPALITYTLLKITGVSLMEETMFKGNQEYAEYKRTTSSFIPWFPRKKAGD
jgi:steroid 5-alpha reductase family enzyme